MIDFLHKAKKDDVLANFAKSYLQDMPNLKNRPPVNNAVQFYSSIAGITLWQENNFQVQMFICKPNTKIENHVHPNVDSYEVYLNGDVDFYINNKKVVDDKFITGEKNGHSRAYGMTARIKPDTLHSAFIGDRGGSFLSIQHWLKGNPSHIGNDWVGKAVSKEHENNIKKALL